MTDLESFAEGDVSSRDEILAGHFGGREVQFGIRKVPGASAEVFFSVKSMKKLDLPLWMQNYCPLIFQEGSEFKDTDVRIEAGPRLTELIRSDRDAEGYFAAQTDDSIRKHLTVLCQLACGIETDSFSLRRSIEALQRKSILRLFFLLVGALSVVVLSVIVISAPVFYKQINVSLGDSQNLGNSVPTSTYVARAQAGLAVRERRIFPSNPSIFLDVVADRTEVTLGGKVVLNYEVYTRYSAKCWGFYNVGNFQNFKVERKDPARDTPREEVQFQGKKFIKFEAGTATLFPLKTGAQIIYPGTVFITARSATGEIMDMYLTTKPIMIKVFEE